MPQYDYSCQKCKKRFTKFLTISEYDHQRDTMKCPRCRSKRVERRWATFFAGTSKKS